MNTKKTIVTLFITIALSAGFLPSEYFLNNDILINDTKFKKYHYKELYNCIPEAKRNEEITESEISDADVEAFVNCIDESYYLGENTGLVSKNTYNTKKPQRINGFSNRPSDLEYFFSAEFKNEKQEWENITRRESVECGQPTFEVVNDENPLTLDRFNNYFKNNCL